MDQKNQSDRINWIFAYHEVEGGEWATNFKFEDLTENALLEQLDWVEKVTREESES